MTPTRPGVLLGFAAAFAVLGYLLVSQSYGSLAVPAYAPVTLVLLVVVELGMARVIRSRILGRGGPRARPVHPLQVARAVVLAKASSVTGAVLLGGYAGILAWALARREELAVAERAVPVAAASVLASAALVIAALVLERACRRPDDDLPDRLRT
jgi:uncharacterized membrane protein YbhN (UPF0104 family)